MQDSASLKKKTISGMVWSFADLMANQGIQFILQIILARLLLPEHFGLIGMVLVFIAVSNTVVDSGFSTALIREKNPTKDDYSTVFYCNLIMGLVMYGIIYKYAFTISSFFGEPQLVPILRLLSLVLIINSFGIIQRVILIRNVDFKTHTKINIVAGITSGLMAVIFAMLGYGVWSLVIKTLSMQLIQLILLWSYIKWIPALVFNVHSFKRLINFSSKTLISTLIGTIYNNIYFVVIGRFYSTSHLGYYTNAVNLSNVFSNTITASIQRVTYPVLSSIKEDDERLKQSFKKVVKMSVFIVFPLMLGLAAIASPLINFLFGDKWMPSVIYLQLLCLAGMLHPLNAINSNILQVKGRSDLYLLLEIIKRSIMTILIVLALFFKTGMLGLIGSVVLYSYITLFINIYYSSKEISYPIREQLKGILPMFFSSFLMGGIVYLSGMVLSGNSFIKLVSEVGIGIIVYVVICKMAKIEELNTSYEMILSLLSKIKRV